MCHGYQTLISFCILFLCTLLLCFRDGSWQWCVAAPEMYFSLFVRSW